MATKSLLILGAGGHAKVVADAASASGEFASISFLDDRFPRLKHCLDFPVIGTLSSFEEIALDYNACIPAFGDSDLRMLWLNKIKSLGLGSPAIVHPLAYVGASVALGRGSVVFAKAVINPCCRIGSGCIINTAATVDHDCVLGEGVHIAPGANLAGMVSIASGTVVGIGSSVIQGINIGENVIVGAGAVVINDILPGITVVGAPARKI